VSQIIYRPLADEGEYPRFAAFPVPASGVGVRAKTFEELVANGDYRPDWLWLAERDGEVVARIAFWAPPGQRHPWSVDYFDLDGENGVEVGAELMRAAYAALVPPDYSVPSQREGGRPDYHLFLPADWNERADARHDAEQRIAAAERFGLMRFVERLNLRWTPADGLPPRSARLHFEPAADRYDELVDVMMRVNENTLDAHTLRDLERWDPRTTVERMLKDAEDLPHGNRDWWRIAYAADGATVGFTLPVRAAAATHWYIGVAPEHRGHRYADDIVAEGLHIITEAGEPTMSDATDVGNAPMAATFARCNYRVVGRRVIMI
jgi:ribosomal protein S18 acetylase RimI-like enzyme